MSFLDLQKRAYLSTSDSFGVTAEEFGEILDTCFPCRNKNDELPKINGCTFMGKSLFLLGGMKVGTVSEER